MALMAVDPLRRIASVVAHAMETLDGRESAMRWLERESASFGGRSPLQVLSEGNTDEIQRVDDILSAIDYGIYF